MLYDDYWIRRINSFKKAEWYDSSCLGTTQVSGSSVIYMVEHNKTKKRMLFNGWQLGGWQLGSEIYNNGVLHFSRLVFMNGIEHIREDTIFYCFLYSMNDAHKWIECYKTIVKHRNWSKYVQKEIDLLEAFFNKEIDKVDD